jgi:hypothetical protein
MTLAHLLSRFREAMAGERKAQAELTRAPARRRVPPAVAPPSTAWQSAPHAAPEPSDIARRRIRDRYLAVRFPGAPHTDEDLQDSAGVVKSARLYFEDGDIDRACELLEFAGEVNHADESPWRSSSSSAGGTRSRSSPTASTCASRLPAAGPRSCAWG